MSNTQIEPTRVVTGIVRLSYCNLFKPFARDGQEAKYSTTVLIPKTDTATMQRVNAAIEAAIQKGAVDKWGGRPPKVDTPVHDGDGARPSDGAPYGPECKGHYVLNASGKLAPEVVDLQGNPIINQSEVYSGMYARISMNFYPYANSGKKGIGCGLGNVQKTQDGEPLGGGKSAAQDFSNLPTDVQMPQAQPAYAPAAPAYQQPAYAPPTGINPITGQPL